MILRIFATDGFTPERIFRWSVDETAEHLCVKQVLWVTRLDAPNWKGLVDWFIKHPACRAVVLDTANRWDWYEEHEITWRIAQGLYFQTGDEERVEAVYWGHDDMAPPTGRDFKEYMRTWLASESMAMEAPAYQLWDDFSLVRTDAIGLDLAGDCHCWLAKCHLNLRWLRPDGKPLPGDAPDRFRPLGPITSWICPWPFRHAKGVDKDFREGKGFVRKGFCNKWPQASAVVPCRLYDPEMTWEKFKAAAN